jgi:hypothetical protein
MHEQASGFTAKLAERTIKEDSDGDGARMPH